jgi:hypothetical protein
MSDGPTHDMEPSLDNCHDRCTLGTMSYRPSANPPVTAWARHLDGVMREQGWSRVRLFEEIGAELGYSPKSRSGFLPLLADKEPTAAQAAVLRRHFGDPAPLENPASDRTPEAGSSDLAAAIRELTTELRVAREERASMAARLAEVEAVLSTLVAATIEGTATPDAHGQSAGSGR